MFKKITTLLLAFIMILSISACSEKGVKKDDEKPSSSEKSQDAVVEKALKLIDSGDIEGAYDLLWEIDERNEEQEEMFKKFKFQPLKEETIYADHAAPELTTYTYNESGYIITRNTDGEYWGNTTYTYDKNNNLLAQNHIGYNGFSSKYIYTYDKNNNLLTKDYSDSNDNWWKLICSYNSDGNPLTTSYTSSYGVETTETHTYDENGNKKTYSYHTSDPDPSISDCEITFDEHGNILTIYCKNGNDKEQSEFLEDGWVRITWEKATFTYDSNGNILTYVKTNNTGNSYNTSYSYTYDKNNNILTKHTTYYDGSTLQESYTYDQDGKELTYTASDSSGIRESYSYSYDEYGNELTYASFSNYGANWFKQNTSYDENQNIITHEKSWSNNMYQKEEYSYDNTGKCVSYKKSSSNESDYYEIYTYDNSNNKTVVSSEYQATYDKYGNEIKYDDSNCNDFESSERYDALGMPIKHLHSTKTYKLYYYPNGVPEYVSNISDDNAFYFDNIYDVYHLIN